MSNALSPMALSHITSIMGILGTTTPSLWPFYESTGLLVSGIGPGDLIPSETAAAAEALEDDFAPVQHPGGVYSYHFHPTGDHHLAGIDHADYSFGDGSVDSAFSLGAFILPSMVNANAITAKFDSAGNLEEYRLVINGSGNLTLELHDASASASEVATGSSTLAVGRGYVVVATYDGTETAPVMNLYLNDVLDNDGTSVETGSYVAMEDTATPLLVGCAGVTATPLAEFHGRIALPFLTGKALTQAEVTALTNIYRVLLGF